LGADDPGRARLDAELGALQNLAEFALPVIDRLAKLPIRAPWGVWLSALEDLATQALRHPEGVLRALAELRPMAEVGPVDLTEVELTLMPRLSSLREEPEGHRFGRVWVGTPEELAGRSFRRVYLPGLAEGLFPAKTREDPLLLDVDRAKLHPELPARDAAVREERRRLHLCLGAASEALEVSYPRLDTARGRARVPSFYALDLLRAAEGRVPNVKAFERRAQGEGQLRLGWPAPERPEQAIDATELDLSLLAAVDPTKAPGLGRYLFGRGLPVEQAIRSFARRWRRPWSAADGLWLNEDRASSLLKGERLLDRAYSPSRLESYAACPYRFFLQSIQRLEAKAEPVRIEQIDPRTKGRIVAEIQFHLVQRLIKAGIRGLAPENLEAALGLLETTLRDVEQKEREDLCPAIPAVWARGFEEIRADLCGWLRDLAANQDGYELLHAELAFGLAPGPDRDPASHPEAATIFGHYRVRGSVDLVERHQSRGDWRVVDHKSGRVPEIWPLAIGGGAHLQILLYAQALEALYGQRVEQGRYAYCTIKNGYTKIDLPNDENTQEALRLALDTIDRALERGQLVPTPKPGACRYCDYATVCGPGAQDRAKLKDSAPAALTELVQLRSRR
jgi:ATP-dependent helicase/nuclease subunit B